MSVAFVVGSSARAFGYAAEVATFTQPLRDSVKTVSFSVCPFVTHNCTQALPPISAPLLPFSTVSIAKLPVCGRPLQLNLLRWLSHHAAATLLDPSFISFAAATPDFVCLAETQRCSPDEHRYATLSVACFPST